MNSTAQATFSGSANLINGDWGAVSGTVSYQSSANQGRQVDELMIGESLDDLNSLIVLVPEPSTVAFTATALLGFCLVRRRRDR
ncbi:MAG: PEP-CTERM sorting domain-containing protein [Pirellulales bacterium]|nr:PEP-CTERM sorting domain-containing protein [Pirellulales bacterium]